jgi:transposase
MKAYSLDLRQKVLTAALRGDRTIAQVAELFGVGTSFIDKVQDAIEYQNALTFLAVRSRFCEDGE